MRSIGKYRIEGLLGRGGMGDVYLARDPGLDRLVALKVLQAHSEDDLARFRREARLVARLNHPNVAQLYEVGSDPPHLAMQYVDGDALDDAELPPRAKISALRDAARAVHYAHQQGVLHRDLKPQNPSARSASRTSLGASAEFILSEAPKAPSRRMAPEQARGDFSALDPRTDVYGLGATLYFVLAGRPPHTGQTVYDVIAGVLRDDPVLPRADRDVVTVCIKAMEKSPARRYASASEFADDLDRYLRNEPVVARPASAWHRLRKRVQRQPVVWTLSALLVASILAGVAGLVERNRRLAESLREARARAVVDSARTRFESMTMLLYIEGASIAPHVGRFAEIRAELETAFEHVPSYAPAQLWISRTYAVEGDHDRRVACLEQAVAAAPDDAPLRIELGRAYLDRALHEDLRQPGTRSRSDARMRGAAERAQACFPEQSESSVAGAAARCYLLRALGRREEMRRLAGASIERFGAVPGAEEFHFLLASITGGLDAVAHLNRAIAMKPGYYEAIGLRAAGYIAAGRLDDAERDYRESLRIHPQQANPHVGIGYIFLAKHEVDRAIAEYDEALKIDPRSAIAVCNRGAAHAQAGRVEAALSDFGRAIEIDRGYAEAYKNRGLIRSRLGDVDAAVEDMTRWHELEPAGAEPLFERGNVRLHAGHLDQAVEDYTAAIALDERHAGSFANRAFARSRTGQLDRAVEDYRRALEFAPAGWPARAAVEAQLRAAEAELRAGDF